MIIFLIGTNIFGVHRIPMKMYFSGRGPKKTGHFEVAGHISSSTSHPSNEIENYPLNFLQPSKNEIKQIFLLLCMWCSVVGRNWFLLQGKVPLVKPEIIP